MDGDGRPPSRPAAPHAGLICWDGRTLPSKFPVRMRHVRVAVLLGLCAVALRLAPPALAQERAALNGYVRDAETGETLLQANVVVEGTGRGAATNNDGYYTLQGLSPGTQTIVFSYLGYQTRTETITLTAGETTRLDVELAPADLQTEEVVVTGEQDYASEQRMGVDKLPVATITELPSVLTPDVFRSLALLPGVTTASDYSSNLYIRGGGPAQTLIQLDRTTVYNPTHFFGFFSTFNPDAIKDVQLYKGTYPAEYGGRLGSVVDIYNKDGNRRETTGGLSLSTLATRGYIEGPYGGSDDDPAGSYMVAVRRSTLEPLLAALDDVDGLPDTFYFYDVNAKATYDAGPNDDLSLAVYGGQDQLFLRPGDGQEFDVDYGNRTLSADWTHLFSDRLFSTLTVAGSRYASTPVFELGGTRFTQTNEVSDASLKAGVEYVPGDQHTVEAGLHASRLTFQLRSTFDGDETFNQRLQGEQAALYLKDTYTPTSDWTIRGGLRATYFSEGDYLRLAPRLSVEHDLTSSVQLQAAYGRYHQFLTLETSQLFTAFDSWLMTDEGLLPSYGDQIALGVNAQLGDAWRLEVEGYARTMRDLFELDPFLPDPAGVPYADRFQVGDGRAYGTEVLIRRPEGRLNGFLSYTLSRTERRFPNINRSEGGTPQYYPPNFDRTHELTLALNYHLTDQWRVSGTFNYATGQAYTRPEQRYELVDSPFSFSPGVGGAQNVLVSPFNNARLPPYHRLDVGVARTGQFFGIAEYELQLQAINAYARRNVWFYQFENESDGTLDRNVTPQIPISVPNVSFSLTF
ncbi:TonB-dependent receptor [Salinibacter ruber]|uniref:TonB-dependent receptor n=1 Tax=Salinibacter ruber TaxID=146919 RepID=UPI002342BD58